MNQARTTSSLAIASLVSGILGWTLAPFLGSVVFLIVGYLLRRGISETAEGLKAAAARPPLLPRNLRCCH